MKNMSNEALADKILAHNAVSQFANGYPNFTFMDNADSVANALRSVFQYEPTSKNGRGWDAVTDLRQVYIKAIKDNNFPAQKLEHFKNGIIKLNEEICEQGKYNLITNFYRDYYHTIDGIFSALKKNDCKDDDLLKIIPEKIKTTIDNKVYDAKDNRDEFYNLALMMLRSADYPKDAEWWKKTMYKFQNLQIIGGCFSMMAIHEDIRNAVISLEKLTDRKDMEKSFFTTYLTLVRKLEDDKKKELSQILEERRDNLPKSIQKILPYLQKRIYDDKCKYWDKSTWK